MPAVGLNESFVRLMDCEEIHRIMTENTENFLHHLEKTLDNFDDPSAKQRIRGQIETLSVCKNDCRYCVKSTDVNFPNKPTHFACAGPPEMGLFKDFPRNECKVVGPKDLTIDLPECDPSKFENSDTLPPIPRFDLTNFQGKDICLSDEPKEICTCSNDGCNNPAGSGQPKPPSGDGTQSGVNPKPAPADDTDQKDNSCQPETLDFLLILALIVTFRFN